MTTSLPAVGPYDPVRLNRRLGLIPSKLLTPLLLLSMVAGTALAQSTTKASADAKEPSGTVSGRVTLEGKPVAGVVVSMGPSYSPSGTSAGKAITDEDGRYTITGVAGASYSISPYAPALVLPGAGGYGPPGKSINVDDGETVDGVDFAMVRGGVITGRVTDASGRPVIDQIVQLGMVDDQGKKHRLYGMNPNLYQTDDRGVYRIYGLTPGRYVVSAGRQPGESPNSSVRVYYPLTYHPGVTDESRAGILELTAGGEVANADIPIGKAAASFSASGRVVDADSGAPIAGVQYGYNTGNYNYMMNSMVQGRPRTGPDGEFKIDGIIPGRYSAFAFPDDDGDFYSEPGSFDITDADVTGITVKIHAASSISGIVVIEGSSDPEVLGKLSQLRVLAISVAQRGGPMAGPVVAADGTFTIKSLGPGKYRIQTTGIPNSGISFLRVEKDGADQTTGITVGTGEQVTGVRVVLIYGSCTIRGTVKVEGGPLPVNARMWVGAHRVAPAPAEVGPGPPPPSLGKASEVDARGRFQIQGLTPGEYNLILNTMIVSNPMPPPPSRVGTVQKTVTVTGNSDPEVTLVLNVPPAKQPDN